MKAVLVVLAVLAMAVAAVAQEKQAPIRTVEIGKQAEFRVNGKPFLPLGVWLADPKHFAEIREAGINTLIGFDGEGQAGETLAYDQQAREAGFYLVAPFNSALPGDEYRTLATSPSLLGWIQGDEPDLSHWASKAKVTPAKQMVVNNSTPFSNLVNGDGSSWTVLEPATGAEFTIGLDRPVTVESLAVWQTISEGLAVCKDVTFLGDGKEILRATLQNARGQQKFALAQPATFKELTVTVTSEHDLPGNQGYASLSEVEGFDKDGTNVLLSKPWREPNSTPEQTLAYYRAVRAVDPTRPVFMTFTSAFMHSDDTWDAARKATMYPALARGADVFGFDVYPIYDAFPGKLREVAEGTAELKALVGPGKPVYAWIETNNGSKWVNASVQLDVKPEHTRAETWMALIEGATAIGYFTHRWVDPDGSQNYSSFAPLPEMRAEMRRLNAQLTRLAPALLAPPAPVKVQFTLRDDLAGHAKATQHEGAIYVFTQNIDLGKEAEKLRQFDPITPRTGEGTITVPGLKAGTKIEVVEESRTLLAQEGRFTDTFGPLAVHVYRVPWRG